MVVGGWQTSVYGLFAHELGSPNLVVSDLPCGSPGDHEVLGDVGPGQTYVPFFCGSHVPSKPHFPYGFSVEPDTLP